MARILVIDDEANTRLMLRLALQRGGHTVEQAADGPEGLDMAGNTRNWDLILLDQRMPGMEGLDVLREIRRRNPSARVIMVTAFGTVGLVREAVQFGAEDFLRKPFTLDTLRGAVQAALFDDLRADEPSIRSTSTGPRLTLKTFNGFRLETLRHPVQRRGGTLRQMLTVRGPDGTLRPCEVILQPEFVAHVQDDTGRPCADDEETFWQALCEEALANYLWQDAQIPFGGVLKVDAYSAFLRRWVLATSAGGAGSPENLPAR